jgi:hypothetical protein
MAISRGVWIYFAIRILLVSAFAVLPLGCGARSALSVAVGAGEGGATAHDDGGPTCPLFVPLMTRSGPCSARDIECDSTGSTCGDCPTALSCFDGRCDVPEGPGADLGPVQPDLLRSLYGVREGEMCTLQTTGALERVEAALWNDGAEGITMEVFVACDGVTVLASTVTLPGSDFPLYTEMPWRVMEHRTTTFVLPSPIEVHEGDVVKVLFHAVGASPYTPYGAGVTNTRAAVEAIATRDLDPHCQFIDEQPAGSPGAVPNPETWDFMVRLYVH